MITAESPIKFDRRKQKDDTLLQLYKNILTPRLIEEKMLVLFVKVKLPNGLVVLDKKLVRLV
jgi:TPP-dependent pyruvate/acetoin dehydrogenase alpha subunit